jgi:hypothetical protein
VKISFDRPTPRARVKATPAVDEAAGATPIRPAAAPARVAPPPAQTVSPPGAFAQLNVGITLDVQGDVEYLMAREGLNKVNAVSDAIRRRAAELRAVDRVAGRR